MNYEQYAWIPKLIGGALGILIIIVIYALIAWFALWVFYKMLGIKSFQKLIQNIRDKINEDKREAEQRRSEEYREPAKPFTQKDFDEWKASRGK